MIPKPLNIGCSNTPALFTANSAIVVVECPTIWCKRDIRMYSVTAISIVEVRFNRTLVFICVSRPWRQGGCCRHCNHGAWCLACCFKVDTVMMFSNIAYLFSEFIINDTGFQTGGCVACCLIIRDFPGSVQGEGCIWIVRSMTFFIFEGSSQIEIIGTRILSNAIQYIVNECM